VGFFPEAALISVLKRVKIPGLERIPQTGEKPTRINGRYPNPEEYA
jgi:hypothetical protein